MVEKEIILKLNQLLSLQCEVINIDAFCLITGWSKPHVYKQTSKGKLPYYKPFGKTIYFKKSEIEDFLLQNRQKTLEEISSEASEYVNDNLIKV